MATTTYGYRTQASGDKALGTAGWFANYNYNWTRMDTHNHDGANSALLAAASIPAYSNSILAVNWVVDGAGWKQTITVPAGVSEVNNFSLRFLFTAPAAKVGQNAYLGYKRLSSTTYEVYCNDNTAAFTAYYR